MPPPIRVLICDEVPLVRDGLRTLLDSADIHVVDATDSGVHAMVLVRTHRPHVVLTGPSLRGLSGIELVARLGREGPRPAPRAVIFSMDDSRESVTEMLRAGAHGYLLKSATREELRSTVLAAAGGETTLAPGVAKLLVDWFRRRGTDSDELLDPQVATLTQREREVLTLMAHGMSTGEIADDLHIGVTTVRTHIHRLKYKLDLRDRSQLVSFAFRAGLMSFA